MTVEDALKLLDAHAQYISAAREHYLQRREQMVKKYWLGHLGDKDDFGDPYNDIMIDGKTTSGPWANMTERSWRAYGCGRFGTGFGQKYEKQPDGKWLKIEG